MRLLIPSTRRCKHRYSFHARLLRHALELHKPVLLLNLGPTRADGLQGVEKIEISSGAVMRDVVKAVL